MLFSIGCESEFREILAYLEVGRLDLEQIHDKNHFHQISDIFVKSRIYSWAISDIFMGKPGRAPKPGHPPKHKKIIIIIRRQITQMRLGGGHFFCFLEKPKSRRPPHPAPRVGDDGGDDGDGRIFPGHPSPILHAPRDIISRKGKSLTPILSPLWAIIGV